MRIGASLVLIAIGAVLRWGVTYRSPDVDVPTVGMVLVIVGAIGLVVTLALVLMDRRRRVVHEDARVGAWDAPPSEVARYDQAPYLHTHRNADPRDQR